MAEVRYGLVEGRGKGKEVRLAASQYFQRRGGHFVNLLNGDARLVTLATTAIEGWLESPKDADGQTHWVSGAARADKAFMIYADQENVFELPASSTLSASAVGEPAIIVTKGATTTLHQMAVWTTAATALTGGLTIVAVDIPNDTVKVKVVPRHQNR